MVSIIYTLLTYYNYIAKILIRLDLLSSNSIFVVLKVYLLNFFKFKLSFITIGITSHIGFNHILGHQKLIEFLKLSKIKLLIKFLCKTCIISLHPIFMLYYISLSPRFSSPL
jgi:hypothetical protein